MGGLWEARPRGDFVYHHTLNRRETRLLQSLPQQWGQCNGVNERLGGLGSG